jgi:hypothetical protein
MRSSRTAEQTKPYNRTETSRTRAGESRFSLCWRALRRQRSLPIGRSVPWQTLWRSPVLRLMLLLVGLAVAFAVSADARRHGAHRGALGGGLLDMGPVAWWLGCFVAPLIFLPCYLVARRRLIAAKNRTFVYAPLPTSYEQAFGFDPHASHPPASGSTPNSAMYPPPAYGPSPNTPTYGPPPS